MTYPRLDAFLHDQRRLAADGRFEHLLHDLVFDEPAEITTLPYRDFADRMAPAVTLLRALGSWQQPHPWVNLLLPDEATEQLVIDNVTRLAMPDSPLVFLCAVLCTATESTALGTTVKTSHLRAAARAAGGTVYLEDRKPLP
ncbi:hypothetical protein [Actinosynnema mirum]|nr:hypothetical protein [Actinosynnema mirum]